MFPNAPDGHDILEAPKLAAARLRALCLEAGADDVGFVDIDQSDIASERNAILAFFPSAKTLISFVVRMNRENIRRPARSAANLEFHQSNKDVDGIARSIASMLERDGHRAVYAATGFPMEMDRWGSGRTWVISHKPIAVAAGLGQMGIHRNVIHPKFGNYVLLGTVLVDAPIDATAQPIDFNPCLECKLCVAACPTGAIGSDGSFNFNACYTHNYREFMGGFVDLIHTVADSPNAQRFQEKVSDAESVSWWQSLSYGPNYKAAYCMAVCPAGEDVITPFRENRKQYLNDIVKPLREKEEAIYVVAGSDAEEHVKRFPRKRAKRVSNGLSPGSISMFLRGLPISFQPGASSGLTATYHFTFTGAEQACATVTIADKKISVADGLQGAADLRITAKSDAWLRFLRSRRSLVASLIRRQIKVNGNPRLLVDFGKCFPR